MPKADMTDLEEIKSASTALLNWFESQSIDDPGSVALMAFTTAALLGTQPRANQSMLMRVFIEFVVNELDLKEK